MARTKQNYGHALRLLLNRFYPPYPYRKYNDSTKSIFIHIPKTAGTSILSVIGAPTRGRNHVEYIHYQKSDPVRFGKYFKFAIVRNPYDRLYSAYKYLLRGGNNEEEDRLMMSQIRERCRDFEEFVMDFLTPSRVATWNLLRPQSMYICDRLGRIKIDFVMRYENIDIDFKKLAETLKVQSMELARVNSGANNDSRSMSKDMEMRIKYLYSIDFELFYQDL